MPAMTKLTRTSRSNLRDLTAARVSLPATGNSIATDEVLSLRQDHARARDAVRAELHLSSFAQRLIVELPILTDAGIEVFQLHTNAPDRATYLRQPNLGRTLHPDSVAALRRDSRDLAIIIADGLSAMAVERNAVPLLSHLIPQLLTDAWTLEPITIVQQGRVAIGDAISSNLGAKCSLILIGERPGLSSPDSMGVYLTWSPGPDRTDADRNCHSNIRNGGLSPKVAADRLFRLLQAARATRRTGISMKEGALELNPE
jgi:ethanolamine ammonia-lyase small subunit